MLLTGMSTYTSLCLSVDISVILTSTLSVLNPNNTNDTPNTANGSQSAAFPSATRVSDVPFTSGLMTMTGSMTSMATSTSTPAPGSTNAANTLRGNIASGAVVGAAALFALAIVT